MKFTGICVPPRGAPPGKKTLGTPSIYRKDSYRYLYGTLYLCGSSSLEWVMRHHSQTHRDTGTPRSASPRPLRMPASASHVSSLSGAPAALPAATRLPHAHAPSFLRPPSSRRGEALWERVEAGSGSLGVASSESAAGGGRLRACGSCESAAASVVALTCGLCVVGGFRWL